ncbi:hypothetical protein YC2023_059937 [Brassica napus]
MDHLLHGVRTITFSWEAMNQPIACVLMANSQKRGGDTTGLKKSLRCWCVQVVEFTLATQVKP